MKSFLLDKLSHPHIVQTLTITTVRAPTLFCCSGPRANTGVDSAYMIAKRHSGPRFDDIQQLAGWY